METNIIQIGNSKGIILPAHFLHKLQLSVRSTVHVSASEKKIIIEPHPRQGWGEAFKEFATSGSEESFFPDVFEDEDINDWRWERK